MKGRICFSVTNDLNYDQRMIRICTSLAKQGYEVLLVGRQKQNSPPLAKHSFKQKRLRCWFQSGAAFYIEYNVRLFLFLLWVPVDIYCAIDLDTILPNLLASKLRSKARVYDAHEYFTEVPEVVRRPNIQQIWTRIGNWAIPQFRYCYTVGDALAKIMSKKYGPTFQVIRNVPVRSQNLIEQPPTSTFTLLYQGVLNEGRGLEVLIRAMKALPEVELWLAGEGDLSQVLRGLTTDLQLHQQVKFMGYLDPEELRKLTPQAHLGLNLLENTGLSYYYSLANKTFDYIQAGLPSLQMDFPEYRALQEKYEVFHLLKNLSVPSVVEAINKIRSSPDHLSTLKTNCQKASLALNWEKEEKKLWQFYAQIAY